MAAVRLPIIVGPTAVGKTAVALELAGHWPLEVISADSRQIYRRLDIGTAKPTRRERLRVPHEGIDLVDPGERYSAGRFALETERWLAAIRLRGRIPVLVGGTGLYVRAVVDGLFHEPPLDPDRRRGLAGWLASLGIPELVRWAGRLDPGFRGGGRQRAQRAIEVALLTGRPLSEWQQRARTASRIEPWYVRLTAPRAVLHHRIAIRAEEMVRRGLIEEVAAVLAHVPPDAPGLDGVGIRQAVEYLQGQRDRASVAAAVATATRQYAKRQETWFRHQLRGPVLTFDLTRGPRAVARDVSDAWERANQEPASETTGEETA